MRAAPYVFGKQKILFMAVCFMNEKVPKYTRIT